MIKIYFFDIRDDQEKQARLWCPGTGNASDERRPSAQSSPGSMRPELLWKKTSLSYSEKMNVQLKLSHCASR